jgi:hypothetical protein
MKFVESDYNTFFKLFSVKVKKDMKLMNIDEQIWYMQNSQASSCYSHIYTTCGIFSCPA